jgi:hypothetical protein
MGSLSFLKTFAPDVCPLKALATACLIVSLLPGAHLRVNRREAGEWIGSWTTAPTLMSLKEPADDSTFRNVVHLSLGGAAIRVVLTNQIGAAPLQIGNAQVALSAGASKVQAGSNRQLTFNGERPVSIPAGVTF